MVPSQPRLRSDACTQGRSNRRGLSLYMKTKKHTGHQKCAECKQSQTTSSQLIPEPIQCKGSRRFFSQRPVCTAVILQTVAAASPATHCAVFPVIASRAATLETRQNRSWHQFQNPPSLLIVVSSLSCCGTLHSLTRVRSRLSMNRPFASRLFFHSSDLRLLQLCCLFPLLHLLFRRGHFLPLLRMRLRCFLCVQRLL